LPPDSLWAAVPYFKELISKHNKTTVTTPIYLDVGGKGMVRSKCTAIETPTKTKLRERLIGILCADYTLPEKLLVEAVATSPLFQVATVVTPENPHPAQVDVGIVRLRGDLASGSQGLGYWPLSHAGEFDATEQVKAAVAKALRENARARQDLTEVELGARKAYLLPLSYSENEELRALLLFPSPLTPSFSQRLSAGLAVFSIAATIALAGFGWQMKRRTVELQHRAAILRTLQVGLIEVNSAKEIEFANDRAEELLDAHLPKGAVGAARATGGWHEVAESIRHYNTCVWSFGLSYNKAARISLVGHLDGEVQAGAHGT
jgi:hypothetical protein